MLDLIYIVEEPITSDSAQRSGNSTSVNFTMPGRDENQGAITSAMLARIAGTALLGKSASLFAIPFLPTALMTSALLQVPSLLPVFTKDRGEQNGELDEAKLEEARLLTSYVQHHSLSRSQAKEAGYCFQPGHPVVGKAYRKHPLNDYPNPDNGNLYIPSDSYDAILLEERESELIKLLVHLGATKISITKKASDKTRSTVTAEASVQAGPMGGGNVIYTGKTEHDTDTLDTREFSLTGRPWKTDSKVDRENFFWLSYEPSWKAVVFAREVGGCLTASLEIKENTSFSTDKNFELSVKAKMVEAGAQAGLSNLETEEKTYFVRAEFAPVNHSA
ncbi:hypothetical protein [Pseudomonas siliginis]|uniref:hypothetical protein n=1 Tax=Pseudomonas siliginis TaxID=2842346 RepID=UPI002092CD51|nr:hypothetical protein [Pseudomonas siliginis]UST88437.1 hypothetical protein NF678_16570 [Pseudomonas siliginis]